MSKKLTIGLSLLLTLAAPTAFAQNAAPPAPPAPEAPTQGVPADVVQPQAVELLKAASAALAGAESLQFNSIATYPAVAANGQPLFFSRVSQVTVQRPDHLRVITIGDGAPDEFYYDGKTMVAFAPALNLAAIAEAPPTLDKLLDHAWTHAGIYFPFADVLASDPYAELSKNLLSAVYLGPSIAVGGVKTEVVAITGPEAAGQIWLRADDHLPRQIRVSYAHDPLHAVYEVNFANWRLGEKLEPTVFASEKAAKARSIPFRAPDADQTAPAPAEDKK